MRNISFALAGIALTLGGVRATAAGPTSLRVAPGPLVQSEEELALRADPARGIEHAVILLDERDVDEWHGTDRTEHVHVRAKILSNEGRDLANVSIPFSPRDWLAEWWGRTILPDGRVLELKKEDLIVQPIAKSYGWEWKEYRAALPGVVPGAIVDYGYDLRARGVWIENRVSLQRPWPIREIRLRWKPAHLAGGAYHVRAPGLTVDVKRDEATVRVIARDLPALAEEPFMPPDPQVRAAVTFYYPGGKLDDYWERRGQTVERRVRDYLSRRTRLDQVARGWTLPPEATHEARLRHAYAWVTSHVRDTGLSSAEEQDEEADEAGRDRNKGKKLRRTADDALEKSRGSDFEVAAVFIGLARGLGAEARAVLAADRRRTLWDPGMKVLTPFRHALVAVRAPGGGEAWTLVDPGSGLPYGEVPWWLAGVPALLAGPQGFEPVQVPASAGTQNVVEAKATLVLDPAGQAMRVDWSRTGRGQQGWDERRWLRDLAPAERPQQLADLCRMSDGDEVLEAEAPALEAIDHPHRLSCRVERALDLPETEPSRLSVGFRGPWIEDPPDFGGRTTRTHPVVLDFPQVAVTTVSLPSPAGYAAGEVPAPVAFESPYGRYRLSIKAAQSGFVVERGFALLPVFVPAAEYRELLQFLDRVRRADRTDLVFVRKEPS